VNLGHPVAPRFLPPVVPEENLWDNLKLVYTLDALPVAQLTITITSGQSNLMKGRIAAACGRFNGIQQVEPVCAPA